MRDKSDGNVQISALLRNFPLFLSQHIALNLPESLPIFELLVNETEELPQVCVGVRSRPCQKDNTGQMHFDIIHLDDTPQSLPGAAHVWIQ